MNRNQESDVAHKRLKNKSASERLISRERFRHNHDQNFLHNQHGKENSYRAQAEIDNSYDNNSAKRSTSTLSEVDDLSFEEQYRTDGEMHNYSGVIEDDKFGEYPRFGKNLNRQARAHKSFAGVGPKGYKRSDERIEDEICEALARDKYIDASDIEVDVVDGIVTLSGSVSSRDDRIDAEVLVERVLGVDDIKNDIKVNRASSRSLYS